MSLIEMRWKPTPRNGFSFQDARNIAYRIGGEEAVGQREIMLCEDGLFRMEIPTVNMVTRWMAEEPGEFYREAMRGVDRDGLAAGPLFEVKIW